MADKEKDLLPPATDHMRVDEGEGEIVCDWCGGASSGYRSRKGVCVICQARGEETLRDWERFNQMWDEGRARLLDKP